MNPKTCLVLAFLTSLGSAGSAAAQSIGPDVIVGEIIDIGNFGSANGVAGFAIGTDACNLGTVTIPWTTASNQHPVIAQNIYRLKGGRLEQLGMSWLKHGFAAVNGSTCTPCQGAGGGLGPGCSDPYGSGLNGSQGGLGPRSQVNASTGSFPYPPANPPFTAGPTARRIQIPHADLDPALNVGASYIAEAHYISEVDAMAGNDDNNASWRPINLASTGGSYSFSLAGPTRRMQSALFAWKEADPGVQISPVDVAGDGRFLVAFRATPVAAGWHWEIAIHNLNSHRSMNSISVPIPAGAVVSNVGFHDVPHLSGDGEVPGTDYDATDWTAVVGTGSVSWSTPDFVAAPNGNALRWGSVYNFRFDTDLAPPAGPFQMTLGLYRPGTPSQVIASVDPIHVLSQVSGDGQSVNAGEAFPEPLVVQVSDLLGAPLAGVNVHFSIFGGSSILSATDVTSDVNGRVQITATATSVAGLQRIRATTTEGSLEFDLETRRLNVNWLPNNGILVTQYLGTRTNMPVLLAIDFPQPPVSVPPYGTVYTSVLNPQPSLIYLDGIGVFGPPAPTVRTNTSGAFSRVFTGLQALAGIGVDVVFQVYALEGGDVIISNAPQVHF